MTTLWLLETTTSGQSNLITGRIAAAHGQFNGIRQVAPVCTPPNICFLGPTTTTTTTSFNGLFFQDNLGKPAPKR